eukprot:TRINITY_DN62560_c0_g1_i1.p1 TRINITY_DN62560_c0_g1~~TRINITY_DN62560_c0_g1_i1.p1  ORF type:complete len:554 (-),score=108.01 TRINITY_DN62560_c0_g1_i1:96-1757(-)
MADDDDYDLWDTLNLQQGASVDDVRTSFRELSRLYHPDKQGAGSSTGSGERAAFMRVHRAYRILGDEALRSFYEKYGAAGVRLAESLSDDEEEGGQKGVLSLPEDRVKELETRVQRLVRKHEELRSQRYLGLNGSFLMSVSAARQPDGTLLQRRFRLHYSAVSHTVQIHATERLRFSVGCASHVQANSGAGAAKLMLAANSNVAAGTNVRAALTVTGAIPEGEISVTRSLSPHCQVQQKVGFSRDGRALSLTVTPWLSRTLRGSLGGSIGAERNLSFSLIKTSLACGHSARLFCNMLPGAGELGLMFKYKPYKGLSMKLAPSLSHRGWSLQATCTKALDDGLTKLHWALQVRAQSLALRLTLCRCGLRFVLPLELWPEAAGPLPAAEVGLAALLWVAPPLVLRLLRSSYLALRRNFGSQAFAASERGQLQPGSEDAQAASQQRAIIATDAARRRKEEEDCCGLVILTAKYGVPKATGDQLEDSVDVTDCLMAKVRQSQLHISNAPKSTLLGFGRERPPSQDTAWQAPVLQVRYRFGGVEYARSFGERDAVLLP